MKQMVIIALALAGLDAGIAQTTPPASRSDPSPEPYRVDFPPIERIDKLGDNLYLIPGDGGTSLVWVYSTGVLLVDAKMPGHGAKLMEMIRRVTDKPVTHIVLTHHHGDHTGSAGEFGPGVEIVSHENTRRNMLTTFERFRNDETLPGLPNHTFDDHLTLFHGKDTVEIRYFGAAHTDGDVVVYFPADRALALGDIMKKKELPTLDELHGGSGIKFPETMRRIRNEFKKVDIVVGGHTDTAMTWNDFVRYDKLSELLLAQEKAAVRAGKTPEQTFAEFKFPSEYQDFTVTPSPFSGVAAMRRTMSELQRSRE